VIQASRVDLRERVEKYIHIGKQGNLVTLAEAVGQLSDIVVERSEFEVLAKEWADAKTTAFGSPY
jgi:hypothetical protein